MGLGDWGLRPGFLGLGRCSLGRRLLGPEEMAVGYTVPGQAEPHTGRLELPILLSLRVSGTGAGSSTVTV